MPSGVIEPPGQRKPSRLNHSWRGQSDAGRCRDAGTVIHRPRFMSIALWELDGASQEAGRIVDVETNEDHARDPETWG